jgi:hypothetical protein
MRKGNARARRDGVRGEGNEYYSSQGVQAAAGFLGSNEGLQSSLHPLPRNGDRIGFAD